MPLIYENPANHYQEASSAPWVWTLLFGVFYFAVKGIWRHAFIAFLLAFFTVGLSWLIYPFFANNIVRTHYLRKGWTPVQ